MKNLIGGEKLDASNGAVIEVINPATKEVIDTVPNSTVEDVDIAVKIAKILKKNGKKYLFMKEEKYYLSLLV